MNDFIEWADALRTKYGIASPIAPDDGLDDE